MNPTAQTQPSIALRLAGVVLYLGLIVFIMLWSMSLLLVPGPSFWWLEWPLPIALILLLISACWRKFRLFQSWRSVGIGVALFVPLLVWLAWDDATLNTPSRWRS
jgi:hypothetical protein